MRKLLSQEKVKNKLINYGEYEDKKVYIEAVCENKKMQYSLNQANSINFEDFIIYNAFCSAKK